MARKATPREPEAPTPRGWKRAGVWIAATAGAAVIGVIVTGVAQYGSRWFAGATISGPAVIVHTDLQPGLDDVSLPVGETLTPSDIAMVGRLDVVDLDAWLVAHKHGIVTSDVVEAVALTGNRQDPVRVVGVSVASTCRTPSRGTLVRQASGRGAGVDSESMTLYPEESDPGPFSFTAEGVKKDYFPARTIVLKQGEQVVVNVDVSPGSANVDPADPAGVRVCDVALAMKLLQGGTESTQAIPRHLTVMDVEPTEAEAEYADVYAGTGVCDSLYRVPPGWNGDPVAACGVGHVTFGAR